MDKELMEKIRNGLDIKKIVKKAAQNFNWSSEESDYAYEWYLKHLYLCIHHPSVPIAAISKSADEVWHQHIIDTRKYATDCNQIAGRYLNHTPIYGKPSEFEKVAYEKTLELYNEVFGELPRDKSETSGDYSYHDPTSLT